MENTISIEKEIQKSYLEYSLSVIIGRAIPDVRDGLKPVHRRILYAMHDLGNTYNRPYKKSARVVGDVIGKYHPHGDAAVYDALVRMAQDFSMRDPLVDGQGNFGSIDGDAAAAMRYTEVRMARLTSEFLADIEKNTVDFRANYDNTLQEPEVLPTKVPNLLLNGSSGIAVGMATNIPPHNLGELVDGLLMVLDNENVSLDKLMTAVKGPDFPTGGLVYGGEGLYEAYKTGRGTVKIRGKLKIEDRRKDLQSIIVTEVPYALNKASLVEKIAQLVGEKKLEGVSDLRDESDRTGIRIVIDLKKGVIPDIVINKLYKFTPLETSFGVNMMAVVNSRPMLLNLKQILTLFLDHRREIILRRTRFDLTKAEERAHILEGLRIALDNIDEVVALIRGSKTPAEAKDKLKARFDLSDAQSQAILDMRLQRLTNLEHEKLLEEYRELLQKIEYFKSVLESSQVLREVVREELTGLKKTFVTPRKTEIMEQSLESIDIEDLIPDSEVVITLSRRGYIKRTSTEFYHQQKRGGRGIAGLHTGGDDVVTSMCITTNHQYLLMFTNQGRMYRLKVYEVPEGSRTAKGIHIANLLPLDKDEYVATALTIRDFEAERDFLFVTKKGMVKRTQVEMYGKTRSTGIKAIILRPGDEIITVRELTGKAEVVLVTRQGKSIRFKSSDVRTMGRNTMGVKGIALSSGDQVVAGIVSDNPEQDQILTVSSFGYGKRTAISRYRLQTRGGKGIINMRLTKKTGEVIGALKVGNDDELILLTSGNKIIRMSVSGISRLGRNTQGVRLVRMDEDQTVISCDLVLEANGDAD